MASDTPSTKKQPKSFEALTPELSSWILDYTKSMNFSRTTPVQGMAIPLLMGNKDLVVEVRRLLRTSLRIVQSAKLTAYLLLRRLPAVAKLLLS